MSSFVSSESSEDLVSTEASDWISASSDGPIGATNGSSSSTSDFAGFPVWIFEGLVIVPTDIESVSSTDGIVALDPREWRDLADFPLLDFPLLLDFDELLLLLDPLLDPEPDFPLLDPEPDFALLTDFIQLTEPDLLLPLDSDFP